MISKEQAEEIARKFVLAQPGMVKATISHTLFFDPEEFIRTSRFIVNPSGAIDRATVRPAHWTVGFDVVCKYDRRYPEFPYTALKFSRTVYVDPKTGKPAFAREFVVFHVCDPSEAQ